MQPFSLLKSIIYERVNNRQKTKRKEVEKMKKILSAVLAATMAAAMIVPVSAAQSDEMAEVLNAVKSRVEVPETDKFQSNSYENEHKTVYEFSWWSESDDGEKGLNITCTSDKVITSYNEYDYTKRTSYDDKPAFPKNDYAKLKADAENFVKKLNPDLDLKVLDTDEALNDYGLYFPVEREYNGIKVARDNGSVCMESDKIKSFNLHWSDIDEFEGGEEKIITSEQAQSAFLEKLGFELVYKYYNDNRKIVFYPAYTLKDGEKYINAVTGEVFEPENDIGIFRESTMKAAAEDSNSGGGSSFSKAEQAEIDKIAGLIPQSEMEKKIRANKLIGISSKLKLTNIQLLRSYTDENLYTYEMTFSDDDKSGAYVTANAKNGEVYALSKYSDTIDNEDVTKDAKTAEKALKALAPSISGEYKENGDSLSRYVNGVRVDCDDAYAYTDKNGKLVSYSVNYTTNAEFPSLDNAINAEEAANKIFAAVPYEKLYMPQRDRKAYLLYSFDGTINLNALTGKMVNYRNEEEKDNKYKYNDLDGHYAKDMIEKLAKFGIGFEGEKFRPNDYITKEDFDALMLDVFHRGTGKVSDEEKKAEITRSQAAVEMVKAMGAGEYAKYDDIYVTPFNDVTENKGYVAILAATGVISGDENGNFNPSDKLTRAEAAVLVYNYLNK